MSKIIRSRAFPAAEVMRYRIAWQCRFSIVCRHVPGSTENCSSDASVVSTLVNLVLII